MKIDQKGFTVIELMIVVAIMGIIAAISIPSLLRSRMSANEASASGGLKTIAAAQTDYNNNSASAFAGNNNGQYPDAGDSDQYINDIYSSGNIPLPSTSPATDTSSTTSSPAQSPAGLNAPSDSFPKDCSKNVDCATPTTISDNPITNPTSSLTSSSTPTPTSTPTSPTPTFSAHYETYTGNADNGYVNDINIKITPAELGGKTFNGIRVDLGGQSLPTPYSSNTNINLAGWGATPDWNCSLGTSVTCQGTTIFNLNTKSIFAFFFTESLSGAPSNLSVQLLENNATAATLTVPLQNP